MGGTVEGFLVNTVGPLLEARCRPWLPSLGRRLAIHHHRLLGPARGRGDRRAASRRGLERGHPSLPHLGALYFSPSGRRLGLDWHRETLQILRGEGRVCHGGQHMPPATPAARAWCRRVPRPCSRRPATPQLVPARRHGRLPPACTVGALVPQQAQLVCSPAPGECTALSPRRELKIV